MLSKTRWVEIFRGGTHAPSSGGTATFTETDLQELAESFNGSTASGHRVPLVLGHPKDNAPAWGWLEQVKRVGNSLFGTFKDVRQEMVDWVENKHFQSISPRIYPRNHPSNPTPGQLNFGHIGALGGQQPAVKGMAPLAFSESEPDGLLDFEFAEISVMEFGDYMSLGTALSHIAKVFQMQRDMMLAADGMEATDKIFPRDLIDGLKEYAGQMGSLQARMDRMESDMKEMSGRFKTDEDYTEPDWEMAAQNLNISVEQLKASFSDKPKDMSELATKENLSDLTAEIAELQKQISTLLPTEVQA